ncbi:Nucleoredoxin-like protein 2 [Strongyloides ratti]|uniref:Nucleoredoxin-like protein 2 n=1 Tax=Strongyloides ratti TaxID=34506 RepID=A0A090L9M1_STRRB|nr:Nucleoredoxin-like protein 2 [Strongyloides ratti]CEF64828.1 Nucleoredoxin-like protein 2 [Strongyloides ratti]
MAELLADVEIVTPGGEKILGSELLKDTIVALYFTASWCPPCQKFTPKLKKLHDKLRQLNKPFTVVVVTKDKEQDLYEEYCEEKMGTFNYLEFGNPKHKELLEKYEIKTIPAMKIIKSDGTVAVNDGVTDVREKEDNPEELFDEWEAFASI